MSSTRSAGFPSIVEHVWNLDSIISESSLAGQLLQTLFGYNSSPALTEMITYVLYLVIVAFFGEETTSPGGCNSQSQALRKRDGHK